MLWWAEDPLGRRRRAVDVCRAARRGLRLAQQVPHRSKRDPPSRGPLKQGVAQQRRGRPSRHQGAAIQRVLLDRVPRTSRLKDRRALQRQPACAVAHRRRCVAQPGALLEAARAIANDLDRGNRRAGNRLQGRSGAVRARWAGRRALDDTGPAVEPTELVRGRLGGRLGGRGGRLTAQDMGEHGAAEDGHILALFACSVAEQGYLRGHGCAAPSPVLAPR